MRRVILLGLLLGALVTFLASPYIPKRDRRAKVQSIANSFQSTCIVERLWGTGMGTGVILDTGYIITAAHVVDADRDNKLTLDERLVTLTLNKETFAGKVVYMSSELDFAIIDAERTDLPGSRSSKIMPQVGHKLYTIGATGGHPPIVSEGYMVTPGVENLPRASLFISGGNSGGGIFDSRGQLIGIVASVGMKYRMRTLNLRLPIPDADGNLSMMDSMLMMREGVEVSNNCLFVPIDDIRDELESKRLQSLIDIPPEQTAKEFLTSPQNYKVIQTVVNLLIFFWVLWYVTKVDSAKVS